MLKLDRSKDYKGTLRTGNLDFEKVFLVKGLKFNLFSVSKMCDKKNFVLFTDTECMILSPDFQLPNDKFVLLKVPRTENIYSDHIKNIVPKRALTCLIAKATIDESKLWHRRLGHLNYKTMNKLVKGNLVRGMPTKMFENCETCVACQKGKQHRVSFKSKTVNTITEPLHLLHMDLFMPVFVNSLNKKSYCLVVTYDFSRFTWVFFPSPYHQSLEPPVKPFQYPHLEHHQPSSNFPPLNPLHHPAPHSSHVWKHPLPKEQSVQEN
jgi:hypothetical protein